MTPTLSEIDRWTRGGGDVVIGNPKPAKWSKGVRSARTYANSWGRQYVKLIYHECVTCHVSEKVESLEWAHVFSGKGDAVHWEPMNMARQCTRCNQLHEDHPEHLIAWFLARYGQPALYELTIKANTNVKLGYSEVMKAGDRLRSMCKEIVERDTGGEG
jgi:cytochrome c peroxidase